MSASTTPQEKRTAPTTGKDSVLSILRRGGVLAVTLAVVFAGAAFLLVRSGPPAFTASVALLASQAGPSAGNLDIITPSRVDPSVYETALADGGVARAALNGLLGHPPTQREVDRFLRTVKVRIQKNDASSVILLAATERSAAFAAAAVNALADGLAAWDRDRARQSVARSIAALESSIADIDAQLAGTAGGPALTAGQRQTLGELRGQRARQLAAARTANESAIVVGLLDPLAVAAPPDRPDGSKWPFFTLVAALFGLLLGYGATFVGWMLDPRIRGRDDLVALAGRPVLAELPVGSKAGAQQVSEAANFMRSAALLAMNSPQQFAIAITSATDSREKEGVAVNLAESTARSGYRTLLVDADLRKPSVTYGLDLSEVEAPPLEVYLENTAVAYEPVRIPIGRKRAYDFVPSFTSALYPVELLNRGFGTLLAAWRESYDVVIVDCPPVLPFADTLSIAPLCDGLMLCARQGETHRRDVAECLERLDQLDLTLVGSVLTTGRSPRKRRGAAAESASAGTADTHGLDPYETLGHKPGRKPDQNPGMTNVTVRQRKAGR